MPDRTKKFHEFALSTELFKGHSQWYICYLKSERVAHTLSYIRQHTASAAPLWSEVLTKANKITDMVLDLCAGKVTRAETLSAIFSLISALRIAVVQDVLTQENGLLVIEECEGIAERLGRESSGVFLPSDQFSVPSFLQEDHLLPEKITTSTLPPSKGHSKGQFIEVQRNTPTQEDRTAKILAFIKSKKGVSIKEISNIVRNCSEKTIQRELVQLIQKGAIKKVGERRWSTYFSG